MSPWTWVAIILAVLAAGLAVALWWTRKRQANTMEAANQILDVLQGLLSELHRDLYPALNVYPAAQKIYRDTVQQRVPAEIRRSVQPPPGVPPW